MWYITHHFPLVYICIKCNQNPSIDIINKTVVLENDIEAKILTVAYLKWHHLCITVLDIPSAAVSFEFVNCFTSYRFQKQICTCHVVHNFSLVTCLVPIDNMYFKMHEVAHLDATSHVLHSILLILGIYLSCCWRSFEVKISIITYKKQNFELNFMNGLNSFLE